MKKFYFVICGSQRKIKNLKISYVFGNASDFNYLYSVRKSFFKEEKPTKISKMLGLIKYL